MHEYLRTINKITIKNENMVVVDVGKVVFLFFGNGNVDDKIFPAFEFS